MRQPEAGAEEGGSVPKAGDQWAVGLGPKTGVESLLTGGPPSVMFYPVLFCTLTLPVVCFFSLHLLAKVGLCCSECLSLTSAPNSSHLEMGSRILTCFLVAPRNTWSGCLTDTFSSGEGRASPFSFLNFSNKVESGSSCHPNGSQVSSRAVPLTCLVSGDGLGGRRVTGLLSSHHSWLQTSLVWRGPCWQGRGEAAALPGRVHPSSWLEGPCCLRQLRVNP